MSLAEGHIAITKLLAQYSFLIDTRRPADVATEVFTPDAVLHYSMGNIAGKDAIAEMSSQSLKLLSGSMHFLGNMSIDIGGDAAASRTYYQSWHWLAETDVLGPLRPVDFVFVGYYSDRLVRTAQGWRIQERTVRRLGPSPVGIGMPTAADAPHARRARQLAANLENFHVAECVDRARGLNRARRFA